MMTRKDYVRTAEILNHRLFIDGATDFAAAEAIKEIAEDFAQYFEEDNERFDYDRFMEAVEKR
jgi:L-ascorbate metabolism protein UlaG (beta-lactamase superfamily)